MKNPNNLLTVRSNDRQPSKRTCARGNDLRNFHQLSSHEKSRSIQITTDLVITVNPLLSPPGDLYISSLFEGGLFNLEMTMVSVLH